MFKSRSEYRKRYFTNFFADPEFDQNYLNCTQISSNIYFGKLRQVFWNVYQKSLTVLNYPRVYIHNLEINVFKTFYTLCGKEDKQVPGCGGLYIIRRRNERVQNYWDSFYLCLSLSDYLLTVTYRSNQNNLKIFLHWYSPTQSKYSQNLKPQVCKNVWPSKPRHLTRHIFLIAPNFYWKKIEATRLWLLLTKGPPLPASQPLIHLCFVVSLSSKFRTVVSFNLCLQV